MEVIKIKTIWRKIGSYYESIQNLFRWFKIIWNDRDYDEYFFYKIMDKKLENMEKFFRSSKTYTADAIKVAEQIREARVILNRIMDDNYILNLTKDIKMDEIISIDDYNFKINYDHPDFEKWEIACEQSYKEREKDKKRFFEHLQRYIDGWWD